MKCTPTMSLALNHFHVPPFHAGKKDRSRGPGMHVHNADVARDHVVIMVTSGSGIPTLGLGVRLLLPHGNTKRSNVLGGKEVQDGPRGNTDNDLQAAGIQVVQ